MGRGRRKGVERKKNVEIVRVNLEGPRNAEKKSSESCLRGGRGRGREAREENEIFKELID